MNEMKRLARRAAELPCSAFTEWQRGIIFAYTTPEHEAWKIIDDAVMRFEDSLEMKRA